MSTNKKKEKRIVESIDVPEGCQVTIQENVMKVKGKSGEVQRMLADPEVEIVQRENVITLSSENVSRNGKRMLMTFRAHIKNLIQGVNEKFVYTLKICSGHFPMTVKVEKSQVMVSNFLGEKIPRKAKILPGVDVKVDKEMITVSSSDIEAAGQTAANIETMTRIRNRDRRVFQDGCYIVETPRKKFI